MFNCFGKITFYTKSRLKFSMLYNEWLSALSPILRRDIMLSSFLFPKILLSFPTVFWILYKCCPLFSPSHLLCRISFNAFFNLYYISNLLVGTLNSMSGCFKVFSLFDPPLNFLLFLYVQVSIQNNFFFFVFWTNFVKYLIKCLV